DRAQRRLSEGALRQAAPERRAARVLQADPQGGRPSLGNVGLGNVGLAPRRASGIKVACAAWKNTRQSISVAPMSRSGTLACDPSRPSAAVRGWLLALAVLVFLVLTVGGATRLTGSGLSITEWRPIVGILPPLTEADWRQAFAEYQRIPQYQQV